MTDTATRTGRTGSKYQALTNLSIPRPGDKDKQTDLVERGDTVTLTDEQARPFLNRRPPVLRKAAEAREPMPVIRPRDLSGRLMGPPADARPDPRGSSGIQVLLPPEGSEPVPGSETGDAVDLPPRGAAALAAAGAGGE